MYESAVQEALSKNLIRQVGDVVNQVLPGRREARFAPSWVGRKERIAKSYR